MPSEWALAEALSNSKFELILLPTEKCNFRCTYCYEDFAIGRMQQKTIDGIKALVRGRAPQLSVFSITWFGGEPLLASDIVLDIGRYAYEVCREYKIQFRASLTTNGYLLSPGLFSNLLDVSHTGYQITLDGDAEWHDKTRLRADSEGTFSSIWKNLMLCRQEQRDFSVSLRLHVHRDNIESVKRLYDLLRCDLFKDHRFTPFFHKISNLSGEKGIPQVELSTVEYAQALRYITGSEDLTANVPADVTLSDYICYAARPNSIMVRADGRVGKCTVALDDPRNDIGVIHSNGLLEIDNRKVRPWFEGYRDMSETALACPLSSLPGLYNTIQIGGVDNDQRIRSVANNN